MTDVIYIHLIFRERLQDSRAWKLNHTLQLITSSFCNHQERFHSVYYDGLGKHGISNEMELYWIYIKSTEQYYFLFHF